MFTIKLRRDHSTEWASINPILAIGEPGYETNTGKFKIGNGASSWVQLSYFTPGDNIPGGGDISQADLLAHINSLLPHTIYDDGPSLLLLYENAKV